MLEGKYNVHEDEVEDESDDLFTEAGWCQNFNTQVMASLEAVSSYDPRPYGQVRIEQAKKFYNKAGQWEDLPSEQFSPVQMEPPEELPAFMAVKWDPGSLGVDLRPHLADPAGLILVDSGSQVSAWPPDPGDVPIQGMNLKAVNGSKIKCYGHKEVTVKIGRKPYKYRVIKADVSSPVIGWDFVRHYRLDLVWNDWGDITLRDKKAQVSVPLKFRALPYAKSLHHKNLSVLERNAPEIDPEQFLFQIAAMEMLGEPEVLEQNEDINSLPDGPYKQILLKFPDLLKQTFHEELPKNGINHRINTEGSPCRSRVRRLLPGSPKAKAAEKAWKELVRLGIVEKVDPSSPNTWSSPVHFVPKPSGGLRVVGDYRQLNERTILDHYPLPHVRDYVQHISGSTIFSKVDLKKAFHLINIDERDRPKTCVNTPWGMFNFRRLSMGMRNAAQSFQRLVDSILGDLEGCFVYLDDVLLFSKSPEEHVKLVEELFRRLDKAGMSIALSKCQFGVQSLDYLGYKVSTEGFTPIPKKIKALQSFPAPQKQKDLLAFLGALNYYRSSLPKLAPEELKGDLETDTVVKTPAAILDPLYKLATCNIKKTKGNTFQDIWNNSDKVRNAFIDAKTLLTKAVTLNYPIPSAPIALSTDASKVCLGASLDQLVNGEWRPLGFWSKSLRPEQQRYSTYIRELMAIKHALRHFINDINGRELRIYTDHKPIIGSWKTPELQIHDPKALNAINEISQWTSDIRYKPGKDLIVPDLLSRPFGVTSLEGKSVSPQRPQGANKPTVDPTSSKGPIFTWEMWDRCPPEIFHGQPASKSSSRGPGDSPSDLSVSSSVAEPKSSEAKSSEPAYLSPSATIAALEAVAVNLVSPSALAEAQKTCPEVQRHKAGQKPKNVVMTEVIVAGSPLFCEVSDPNNPRPLVPEAHRSLIVNLAHHQDHPGAKETLRRVAQDYYWPCQRKEVESFVRTCHPCQMAKNTRTVDPGVGRFPVPDQRFSVVHVDVVGPLPDSDGFKYLLTCLDRTSRWLECYKMKAATSLECCKGFMDWISRFGLPSLVLSDNGNTFISNLWKDVMSTFNIPVRFTPAYHAATNGAIERRHQTIKNALKASLIDMGNSHGDKWSTALPWVLLGKRSAFQPDLDTSAALLTLGKSPQLPCQLFGDPGPPLNTLEVKSLLDELYKMAAKPALQTSTVSNPIDTAFTDKAKRVYVKLDNPTGLSGPFEGPFPIISRPSRSQVQVKIGSYADGRPRLQTYNWDSCKISNDRPGQEDGTRSALGRRPAPKPPVTTDPQSSPTNQSTEEVVSDQVVSNQVVSDQVVSDQVVKPPSRPTRATRNPKPQYID